MVIQILVATGRVCGCCDLPTTMPSRARCECSFVPCVSQVDLHVQRLRERCRLTSWGLGPGARGKMFGLLSGILFCASVKSRM